MTSPTCKDFAIVVTTKNRVARLIKKMNRKRHITTEDDIAYIKEHFAEMSSYEIADVLGMSKTSVSNIAYRHGLRKSREWIAERARMRTLNPNHGGRAFLFKKGHTPHTKGKRAEEWMTPEGLARSAASRFKKGQRPATWKPLGSERINVDGYIEVKVEEGKPWRHKHRVMWEEANGAVPDGYMVSFIDGNKQNCVLSNLKLVARADAMRQNSVVNYPDDVREIIHMRAVLKRHINTQKRKRDGNK
jgi:hypothetical protein